MASSDNLVTIEQQPWRFGQAMEDCWISDFFMKESDTLTRALTKLFTNSSPTDHTSTNIVESLLVKPETTRRRLSVVHKMKFCFPNVGTLRCVTTTDFSLQAFHPGVFRASLTYVMSTESFILNWISFTSPIGQLL
ncbi:calmodulin-binding protein 25-like [Forsythia ovata]|uniref:Calmodulin-binding protein 25-like n=1 Tax=Forsythia ovata TaxID=205694 RepID=A0ABD1WX59_9LAMI